MSKYEAALKFTVGNLMTVGNFLEISSCDFVTDVYSFAGQNCDYLN
jgi:hypothetical protein